MELLIIIVNKEEYFEKILYILVESGISGASILDSEGLGHFLAYEVPIFAGIRSLMGEKKSANRTILAVLENKSIFNKFKNLLVKENIDFTKSGVGIIATVTLSEVIKSKREFE